MAKKKTLQRDLHTKKKTSSSSAIFQFRTTEMTANKKPTLLAESGESLRFCLAGLGGTSRMINVNAAFIT